MCGFAVDEGGDNVTKRRQGEVDLRGFFETLTCGTCLRLSLRTLLRENMFFVIFYHFKSYLNLNSYKRSGVVLKYILTY